MIGAAPTASADELRRAYLRRARSLHPDQSGETAGMQELNAAWEVLGDPRARAAYDRERTPAPAPVADPTPEHVPTDGPPDPLAAVVRVLPVVALLLLLFAVFVFTAYAGRGSDDGGEAPSTVPAPTGVAD